MKRAPQWKGKLSIESKKENGEKRPFSNESFVFTFYIHTRILEANIILVRYRMWVLYYIHSAIFSREMEIRLVDDDKFRIHKKRRKSEAKTYLALYLNLF